MARLIERPAVITAAGQPPKMIEEFIGVLNSGNSDISVARMKSPAGWAEPGQCPEFMEITIVLAGRLHVECEDREFDVKSGQAVIINPGEWVKYSTPNGAEYIAICTPAFTPETVNKDPM